jgi:cytochrome c oxidase accessory protein FixG
LQTLKPKLFNDRLTTTDEQGHRVRVIPMAVHGYFQKMKDKVHLFLVLFFLALPWIKVGQYPALLLDVPNRRFFLLGHLFLPQDVPGVFFIIAFFAMALLFFTALYGRVWCGWACPQTVFIEGFFRRVERWIEGNHLEQRELDKRPWDFFKIRVKSFKWFLFVLGSLVVTHSFLAYFVGADNVLHMILRSPAENPGSFAVVMVSTAVILFDFGWFREQFCLVACPYGRFQSALMDENSLTIAYDARRGEPRKGLAQSVPAGGAVAAQGDCINCLKCVKVCPTGIDIRNGFQMECIACTACADACDEVMLKIEKPVGLIRYMSDRNLQGEKHALLRPRVILYGLLLVFMLSGLTFRIVTQETYQTEILRAVDTPYQLIKAASGDQVINHFKVNWYNVSPEDARVELRLPENLRAEGFELIQTQTEFSVVSAKNARHQFFVKFPVSALGASQRKVAIESHWQTVKGSSVVVEEVTVVGPDKSL